MTAKRPDIPEQIRDGRVIAIGRGLDPTTVLAVGEALLAGGVRAFEVTLNSPGAFEAIALLAKHFPAKDLLIGAGTVLSLEAAASAAAAGGRFLVMPHTDLEIIAWAAERGIPTFPGAFTPTEIVAAWRAGASAVKLFPASAVGPAFVKELRGPFPEIPLIPTGGVTLESTPAYIDAGAMAIGVGSWLTGQDGANGIRHRARLLIEATGPRAVVAKA